MPALIIKQILPTVSKKSRLYLSNSKRYRGANYRGWEYEPTTRLSFLPNKTRYESFAELCHEMKHFF